MKPYFVTISSKNKNSILKFLSIISEKIGFKVGSGIFFRSNLKGQKKKKIFTILKSPHVNKKAQEQFEIRIFSQQLILYGTYSARFVYFLKRLKLQLFPEIKLKIKFLLNKTKSLDQKIFNLTNYKFKNDKLCLSQNYIFKTVVKKNRKPTLEKRLTPRSNPKNSTKSELKGLVLYLNVLGVYSELYLKK